MDDVVENYLISNLIFNQGHIQFIRIMIILKYGPKAVMEFSPLIILYPSR